MESRHRRGRFSMLSRFPFTSRDSYFRNSQLLLAAQNLQRLTRHHRPVSPSRQPDVANARVTRTRVRRLSPQASKPSICKQYLANCDLLDQIRPDWEAKLAAVRAAVTRRANRRIVMRQVGDRLIPVGVTSGRVHANMPGGSQLGDAGAVIVTDTSSSPDGQGRREGRFRRAQNQDLNQLLGGLTIGGQDLEEVQSMSCLFLAKFLSAAHSLWSWRQCGYLC